METKILSALTLKLAQNSQLASPVYSLEHAPTAAMLTDVGLTLSTAENSSVILHAKDIATTGYVWIWNVVPEDCLVAEKIVPNYDIGATNTGEPKQAHVQVSIGNAVAEDICKLSLVQARPWMFKGFDSYGSFDESSTTRSYEIPVYI